MVLNPLEIIQTAANKGYSPRGIGLASSYIKTIIGVRGIKGFATILGDGADEAKIRDAVKNSESELVFTGSGSAFTSWTVKDGPKLVTDGPNSPERKNANSLTPGSIMDFEAVVTTKNKDRDGDELNPLGCKIDQAMPLLWQHLPFQPIGKLYEILEQSAERIKGHFGIADTMLGRDAATLVAFGALRLSQGFKPTKFEMLRGGEYEVLGYVIHEWEMHEASLVSIPANDEAIITAFSREKLHHPMIKSWAKSLHDDRPVVVPVGAANGNGGNILTKGGTTIVKIYTGTKSSKKKPEKQAPPENDDKTGKAETETETETDDTAKNNPLLGDMVAALEKMVGDESVPPEARARLSVCHTILSEASNAVYSAKESIDAAVETCDIGALKQIVDKMSATYAGAIGKAADELNRVSEIDGIPDSLSEIKESVEMLASLYTADDGIQIDDDDEEKDSEIEFDDDEEKDSEIEFDDDEEKDSEIDDDEE